MFVAGGHVVNSVGLNHANLFDPATQGWSRVADMQYSRWYPTCTTLPDGLQLTTSGKQFLGPPPGHIPVYATIPEVYLPEKDAWSQLPDAELDPIATYPYMFLTPDGKVFYAGKTRDTRELDLVALQWSQVHYSPSAGGRHGSAVMYGSKGMKCAGSFGGPQTTATAVIDLGQPSPAWASVGSLKYSRHHLNLVLLPDGTTLAFGGETVDITEDPPEYSAVYAVEQFDPGPETWEDLLPTGKMTSPRKYHSTALLLQDATVLVAGGDGYPNADIFSPPYLDGSPTRCTIDDAPDVANYGDTFEVTVDLNGGSSVDKVSLLRLGAITHSFDQNQRFIDVAFTTLPPPPGKQLLQVTPPADANAAPPGYYMLFVLTTVNSVLVPCNAAAYVRVSDGLMHAYPASVSDWKGTITGDETDLLQSDNSYLVIDHAAVVLPGEPRAGVEVTTTAPPLPIEGEFKALTFTLEAHTTNSQDQKIFLYNYLDSAWDEIYDQSSSTQDTVVEVTVSGGLNRYINSGTREMKARVGWFALVLQAGWQAKIDHVLWSLDPQ